jgi:hypothetical protein
MMSLKKNDRHLNVLLVESIDDAISILLSRDVVDALYVHLQKIHSVSRDEVPCKIETLCAALEKTFGVPSSRIISKVIARRLYAKLGLPFTDNPSRTLLEYVEEAKIKLQDRGS